jgi:hypothetical protein
MGKAVRVGREGVDDQCLAGLVQTGLPRLNP